jgi:hypothetical protein
MKLASELRLDQLLTQFLPGFDHQGEGLGPPFLTRGSARCGRRGLIIKAPNGTLGLGAPSHRSASTKLMRSTPMCCRVDDWHLTRRTRF